MKDNQVYFSDILRITQANAIVNQCEIQELWSGYGQITRLFLKGGKHSSVVVKHILFPNETNHPRGWNTNASHQRKVQSYAVENYWYQHYAHWSDAQCKIPKCLGFVHITEGEKLLILEDLDASGYPVRRTKLNVTEAKIVIRWLAYFHARFMHQKPIGLWPVGTYWHLSTRQDEWEAMVDGILKQQADKIDERLNQCQYQTLVHGDAKVANFCFSYNGKDVAAVDFQYVGGGCGIKDLVYFLGSCLNEKECENSETELLGHYFQELNEGLNIYHPTVDKSAVEKEYRQLYALAWTDFTRFLKGWCANHKKLNNYSERLMTKALETLNKK
jgi:hypothetical protein